MTVRVATVADEEALFWLLMHDYSADNDLGFSVSPLKVYDRVHACCMAQGGIAGVIDGPDGIIGTIGIEAIQPWYSEDWILIQTWQFVLPEHRHGTTHGADLFAFAEAHRASVAKAKGADILMESMVMSEKRLEAKARLWRRKAGRQIGVMFWSGNNVQRV